MTGLRVQLFRGQILQCSVLISMKTVVGVRLKKKRSFVKFLLTLSIPESKESKHEPLQARRYLVVQP